MIDPVEIVDTIGRCRNEVELAEAVRGFLDSLGIGQLYSLFISMKVEHGEEGARPLELRYLSGCSPALLQMYGQRRWYMNDPFISYALHNTAPLVAIGGFGAGELTGGQRQFLEAMKTAGFRSLVATPSRMIDTTRVGMLLIGSPLPGHYQLQNFRPLYRALAAELIEWRSREIAREQREQYGLSVDQVEVIGMLHAGSKADDIALRIGKSVNEVYRTVYTEINEKMGKKRITDSARAAFEAGLLNR